MSEISSDTPHRHNQRKSAWLRVQKALTLPAQVTFLAAAMGTLILAFPMGLGALVTGLGVNLLSSLLDRVARGEHVSDLEINQTVVRAVSESNIDVAMQQQDTQAVFAEQFRRLELLEFAVGQGERAVIECILEQSQHFGEVAGFIRQDLAEIESKLNALDQGQLEMLDMLRSFVSSHQATTPDIPSGQVHYVPVPPSWLVERQPLHEVITGALKSGMGVADDRPVPGRTLTIFGAPGVGKTVLACALALDPDVKQTFRDGIVWLDLGKTPDLPLLQSYIGTAFGDGIEHYTDARSGKARLGKILREKQVLLVLDDVWNTLDVGAFRLSAANGVCCLVTTRSRRLAVTLGGPYYEIPPLTLFEAMALVAKRVGADNAAPGFLIEDAHQYLIYSLGGNAQAISIAAAHLARRGNDFAVELSGRIAERLRTDSPFKDLSPLDADDHRADLDASLSVSYEDLPDALKRCFRVLGVFASTGTFDSETVSALMGDEYFPASAAVEADEIEDVMDALVDASLLTRHENRRYSMQRVVKYYALALLRRAGELNDVVSIFDTFYLKKVMEALEISPHFWNVMGQDLAQVHEVANFYANHVAGINQYPDIITELERLAKVGQSRAHEFVLHGAMLSAHVLKEYVRVRNPGLPGLAWLLAGLVAAKTLKSRETVGTLARAIGEWYKAREQPKLAMSYYDEALSIWKSLDDKHQVAETLLCIAVLYVGFEGSTVAIRILEKLSADLEGSNDALEADVWSALGATYSEVGDYEKALALDQKALTFWQAHENEFMQATILNNIGMIHRRQGKLDLALKYLRDSFELVSAVGYLEKQAACLYNIGGILAEQGENAAALETLLSALSLAQSAEAPRIEAFVRYDIAQLLRKQGHLQEAIEWLQSVIAIKSLFDVNTDFEKGLLNEWAMDNAVG